MSPLSPETLLQHLPQVHLHSHNQPIVQPIYQTAKFAIQSIEEFKKDPASFFLYSRHSNPTVRQLEQALAQLENREEGAAFSSGMAALSAVLIALLKQGDHVVSFIESYEPGRCLIKNILSKFGIESTFVSMQSEDALEKAIRPGVTQLILFESPTNPMCRTIDFKRINRIASQFNLLTLFDGTFSGLHQSQNSGADLVIHSLTKFAAGHGDVLGGVVLGDQKMIAKIHETAVLLGATLDPHAASLILRGLKTYFVRFERQTQSAEQIARWLSHHQAVEEVFYPGLETDLGHSIAKKQMKSFGSMLSLNLNKKIGSAHDLLARLKVFQYTVSLGSTESIATPLSFLYARDLTTEERFITKISEQSLRLSIGLENPHDLIADLEQALDSLITDSR